LIVLPVILLEQWAKQIYMTTGHKALIYHGASKKKIDLFMLYKSVIVLTSYQSVVIRNTKKDGIKKSVVNLLHSVRWNRLVFDEAHHLRNTKTKLFSSCYSLNSNIRWLMTGTPIQNKEKDFNSLCLILRIPMEMVKKRFILRRTKKDAGLFMPRLDYHLEKVNWSTMSEMALSQSLHSHFQFSKVVGREKKLDDLDIGRNLDLEELYQLASSATGPFVKGRGALLRLLSASRQTCILPKLLKPALDHFVVSGEIETYDRRMITSCSKMNAVVSEVLGKRENGNGKLIFCHYHLEMMYLYEKLVEGGMKVLIYGKMPKSMEYRGPVLGKKENLNDLDYDVVIIQIQTGCEGLNLQKYSEVYFVSPHWNPMVEEQAIARCHRIGQEKAVSVSHFTMEDFECSQSLDHYILDTQERKKEIIRQGGFL
jgi:SNF2 family DNA or RNA helicase